MLHGEDIARRVDLPQQLTLLHMLVVLDAQAGRAVSRLTTHASHRQKRLGHTSDGQQERAVLIDHLGCSRSNRKARYNVNSPVTMVRKANNSTQRPGGEYRFEVLKQRLHGNARRAISRKRSHCVGASTGFNGDAACRQNH